MKLAAVHVIIKRIAVIVITAINAVIVVDTNPAGKRSVTMTSDYV
ncbi:hypothetical protein ABZ756_04900 [Mammaliicoccus sciuri]